MNMIIGAFCSCLPMFILSIALLLLAWKNRGRIESIEFSKEGFKIQFGKSGRRR